MRIKRHILLIAAVIILTASSVVLYFVHYLIFDDPHHIFIYLVGDLAFVPIEILLVAIIVERIIDRHEKGKIFYKLNMVIGTFFSELGTWLIGELTNSVMNRDDLLPYLRIDNEWTEKDYRRSLSFLKKVEYRIQPENLHLNQLHRRLANKRDMLVMFLNNPNILEHERFADLLWAIFHLMEELDVRKSFDDLPQSDLRHIAGDVQRVYSLLTIRWLQYCRHLQKKYPFLFSIIVRTHPLQERPDAVVAET